MFIYLSDRMMTTSIIVFVTILQLLAAAAAAPLDSKPLLYCRPGWTKISRDGMCYKMQMEDSNTQVNMYHLFL